MKLREILTIVAMLLIGLPANAQNNDAIPGTSKANVLIDYVVPGYAVERRDLRWVDALGSYLRGGVAESNHVNAVAASDIAGLRTYEGRGENDLQFTMGRYKVMNENRIDYVVECEVGSIHVELVKREKNYENWRASMAYKVRVVTPADGKTLASMDYLAKDNEMTGSTPEKAITGLLEMAASRMNRYIKDNFHVQGQILQLLTSKNDEAATVAVNVGPANGAKQGTKFEVMTTTTVAGRTITQKIGELKIKEIKADDLSIGEVKKGKKEIKAALDSGKVLMISSANAGFWD